MNNSIDPFIHNKIIVLNQHEPAHVAAQAMNEKGVGCILVSSGHGRFLGLLTDRDLVRRAIAQGHDIDSPIGWLITDNPLISVTPSANLLEVLKLMEEYGIRRVPVIKKLGRKEHCEGLISLDDLIVAKRVSPDQLSRIIRCQVRPKKVFRRLDRRMARRDQTYGKFMTKLRKATGLEKERADEFLLSLLSKLVQRLPQKGADQFASQLPGVLQDALITYPPGPNRKVTANKLVKELQSEFDLTDTKTVNLCRAAWRTLKEITKSGELNHVIAQLPEEFEELLQYPVAPPVEGGYGDYYENYNG
jgi:CBS domain-containing protein/uncharacterized protein (DUF2267 family)